MDAITEKISIQDIQQDVLSGVVRLCAYIGALVLVWTLIFKILTEQYILAVLNIIPSALFLYIAFYPKVPHYTRSYILIAVIMVYGYIEYTFYGIYGDGNLLITVAVALTSIVFNRRIANVAIGVSVLVIASIGFLRVTGYLEFLPLNYLSDEGFSQWFTEILLVLLFGAALNYLTTTLMDRLAAGMRLQGESEERYKLLADNVDDVIWTADMEYRCTFVTPSINNLIGFIPDEVLGKKLDEFALKDFEPEIRKYFNKFKVNPLSAEGNERILFDIPHVAGHSTPTETLLSPLRDESGAVYGILGVTRNVTERTEAEEERNKLESQLRYTQRMEAVGQLAGGVAHDFNNLLQAIMGYSELIQQKLPKDSPNLNYVEHIIAAGQRARALVRQLLAFSRKQVLELEVLECNDIIVGLSGLLDRVIGEHITLKYVEPKADTPIYADLGQIEQILINLCVNARDAMPDGGTLTIETDVMHLDEDFCRVNAWAKGGDHVVLSVSDTGQGMDGETQEKIFDPFFTTKELGKGTGLGLSTVFGIVRQHGGMVKVYSEIDVGTTFRVYLPLAQQELATAVPRKHEPIKGGSEVILLADDDAEVCRVGELILSGAGYTVLKARDGQEAISVLNDNAAVVKLLILDIVMPTLGGKGVYDHVQELYPDVQVLFSSGYSQDGVHSSFVPDATVELIQKPYQREALLRKVREMLDRVPG